VRVHLRLKFMNINELLVQWWESGRRILVWLGPGKHKNAIQTSKTPLTHQLLHEVLLHVIQEDVVHNSFLTFTAYSIKLTEN